MTNESTVIDNANSKPWLPWLVCLSAACFFFYEFLQLNMLNALNEDLMQAFNIDATQMSFLSASYFFANMIFIIPAGLLLDRFSTRTIILASMSVCMIGAIGFAMSANYEIALFSRILIGIGAAFCFLSSIRLASHWFEANHMALISGLIVTLGMLGGWVAQNPLTLLIEHIGWRHALWVNAILGVLIFLLIYLVVYDYPSDKAEHIKAHRQQISGSGFLTSIKHSYLNPQNWLSGLYTSLMNLPIFLLGALWGIPYLEEIHHLSRDQSSVITGMIFFGTVIGSPAAGFISDKMGLRKRPMIIAAIISLAMILWMMYQPGLSASTLAILFFALGFITSAQIISYPLVTESNPISLTAISISVIAICAIGGGAVFQPLFGWLMDFHLKHQVVNHVMIYSANDFHRAMLIFPAAFVIALICAMLIKETHCKRL